MTTDQKDIITNLRKAGYSYTFISRKLGFSKSTVATFCRRNGMGSILVEKDLITSSKRAKVGATPRADGFESKVSRAYKVHYKFRDTPDGTAVTSALEILRTKR